MARRVAARSPATGIQPDDRSPRQIGREFLARLEAGARLKIDGEARHHPGMLLVPPYRPRHKVSLFNAEFYLTDFLFDEAVNFFVAYVVLRDGSNGRTARFHPRIFYKDSSLVWRVASHFVKDEVEYWIGKGDVKWIRMSDGEHLCSAEETTNLPYEIQAALDEISRRRKSRKDEEAIELVLRRGPKGRVEPYADFTAPRRAAPKIHRGRKVARLTRKDDPTSLTYAPGFEPDFARGVLEISYSGSRTYGGDLRKFRIRSKNREIQYYFIHSPTHAWVNPPQALTQELTSYGVRPVDVIADDDIFIPGYEYHYVDESVDPPELHSQIPEGYAGEPNGVDGDRVDASRWIEKLPIIRDFRRKVLARF